VISCFSRCPLLYIPRSSWANTVRIQTRKRKALGRRGKCLSMRKEMSSVEPLLRSTLAFPEQVYCWSWRRHLSGSVSLSDRQRQCSRWRPQIRITVGHDSYMNMVGHAVAGVARLSRNPAEHQYQAPCGNLKPISTADLDGSANEITPPH
jgi:hypothetical protein